MALEAATIVSLCAIVKAELGHVQPTLDRRQVHQQIVRVATGLEAMEITIAQLEQISWVYKRNINVLAF